MFWQRHYLCSYFSQLLHLSPRMYLSRSLYPPRPVPVYVSIHLVQFLSSNLSVFMFNSINTCLCIYISQLTRIYQPYYIYISTFDCSYLLILIYSSRKHYGLNLLPTEICITVLSRLKILFFLRLVYFNLSMSLSIYLSFFRGGNIYKRFFFLLSSTSAIPPLYIYACAHTYSSFFCFLFFLIAFLQLVFIHSLFHKSIFFYCSRSDSFFLSLSFISSPHL